MTADARTRLAGLMDATVADEQAHSLWDYVDARPQPIEITWHAGVRIRSDCSKGVQRLAKWAGVKDDPMGLGYGPYGNSASICMHLHHADRPEQLETGDIITFGPNGDEHAAMVRKPGTDPLLWSDGHQGAPNFYRLSQDGREHQLLKLNAAPIQVTPEDKLRALTGYFSWVAWRLGEGPWKHYGPMNAHVRPSVPTNIRKTPESHDWFERLDKFLAARHLGNPPSTAGMPHQ